MHLRLRPHFALLWIVALLPFGLGSAVKAQSTTICQNLGSGIVTCRDRPDPLKQLQDTVEDIVADRNAKKQREAEAAYRASQLEQQQELIRLQREAAEAERARLASIRQQQAYAQSQQEADRQAEQLLRTQVSTAVLEGRCDDAKTIALLASRIDMAEQAVRLCKPKVVEVAPTPRASAKGLANKGKGVNPTPSKAVATRPAKPASATAPSKPVPRPETGYAGTSASVAPASDEAETLKNIPEYAAALQGSASHQTWIGWLYFSGNQGVPQNYASAAKWFMKAALQGDANAQRNLGVMYKNGTGVPQDFEASIAWFRKAAVQGDAESQFALGSIYEQGLGITRDYTNAANWFYQSAIQGYAKAQRSLGELYDKGNGVPQSRQVAATWYEKAAAQGDALAILYLGNPNADSAACGDGTSQPLSKGPPFCADHGGIIGLKAAEENNAKAVQQLGHPKSSLTTCVDGAQTTSTGAWGCSAHGGIKQLRGTNR